MSPPRPSDEPGRRADVGILRLAGPLVISFWVRAGFTIVDIFYAKQILAGSDAATAAIGLTAPFDFVMIACWVGTSNGLTSRLSAAMGAGEGRKIEQLKRATTRIISALALLFVGLAAGIYFAAPHLVPDAELARQFGIYAGILLAGSAFTSFWSILPDSIVKAHQDTRSTMWAGLLSGFTNLVLNTVFVFVFHWAIAGIALSTVLGRLAGLLFALGRARAHEQRREAAGRDTAPGVFERPLKAILVLALPASFTFLFLAAEAGVLNRVMLRFDDPIGAVAAWTVFDQATRFMSMPAIAIGVALLPLTARCWGRRDFRRISRELGIAVRVALGYVAAIVLPLALLGGPLLADHLTNTDEARSALVLGFRWLPFAVLAASPMFLFRSTFEGMQRPLPGLLVSAVRTVLLIVPLVVVGAWLAPRLGYGQIAGAYLGFTLGAAGSSTALGIWLRSVLRQETADRSAA